MFSPAADNREDIINNSVETNETIIDEYNFKFFHKLLCIAPFVTLRNVAMLHKWASKLSGNRPVFVDTSWGRDQELPKNVTGTVSKTVGACFKWHKRLANLVLTTDDDKLVYLKQYNCNPPPLFILFVSLAELVMFIYYGVQAEHNQWITISQGLVNTPLIYDPWKRKEVWRFISYMFLHAGIEHILGNVILQLVIGIMLEMVHKSSRVCTVYMSGVLAGSFASSIFDPYVYLVGASGGVYALLGGYLSNIIMNWKKIAFNGLHLLFVLSIAIVDLGFSLYRRFVVANETPQVSLAAHFAGGLAGISIGYVVFSNFNKSLVNDSKWWVCLIAYCVFCGFATFWNLFLTPVGY